jgi:hypothetical protein
MLKTESVKREPAISLVMRRGLILMGVAGAGRAPSAMPHDERQLRRVAEAIQYVDHAALITGAASAAK